MTTKNKDLFFQDPTQTKIPNDGFAQVVRPETPQQWDVLEWELRSFVCDGEFERGLERILDSFLANLGQSQQPAVWVSGFYGSGKSHLCRVIEYLWRDVELPSGETARSLVNLPSDIEAHFRELSTAGKRLGGLWSAAGTLGAGKSQEVRLAFLSVLFDSAGLPKQYPLARFTMWAESNGYLAAVEQAVAAAGKEFDAEVQNLYVSPVISRALLDADPSLGDAVKDVRQLLHAQFPATTADISDDEMFEAIEDVLRLQTTENGRYPLTLVVLDEMQQYLGDDHAKTLAVQNIVEGVSSKFENCMLFLATGQSAMGGTPTLEKLTDRFPVRVHLSDKDVETVVRQVILRKKPDRVAELEETLAPLSGEIDRHLGGTRIAPTSEDKKDLIPDYPLLPTRRRFWELALRALDRAGKSGVLRTQLRIVHEAAREVADDPVGHVVGADFLYDQQAPILQQSGELLKEISESILALKDETGDGELKSRICALVFLITNIPSQMMGTGETGLRASSTYICDLLVEDLRSGGAKMRKKVPELLEELVSAGRLMRIEDEYRLQTEEGAEWEKEYRTRLSANRDDPSKLAIIRNERLYGLVDEALGGIRLTHGKSKTPRRLEIHFGDDEPLGGEADIPVWIRDEWTVTSSAVKNAAAQAGEEDPVLHVLLPKRDAETLKDVIASYTAAKETVQAKPTPQTDEGKEAQRAMKGRMEADEERLRELLEGVVGDARVYQGGGTEVSGSNLREAVELAANHSLVRLFPRFHLADDQNWGKVVTKARDGAPDALTVLGYTGDVRAQSVCKELLDTISAAGTKGSEIRARFMSSPFGWHEDAIRGGLMTLLASHYIRAAQDGAHLSGPKQLEPRQVGKTTFFKEDDPPSTTQRMAVRGLLTAANVAYENSQEQAQIPALLQKLRDLAGEASGAPPLPESPDTSHIEELQSLGGNQQFRAVAENHERLKQDLVDWGKAVDLRADRLDEWDVLNTLLRQARDLEVAKGIAGQMEAIQIGRQLLHEPDPIQPLIQATAGPLRERLHEAANQLKERYTKVLDTLEASDDWQLLDAEDRTSIMVEVGLASPTDIDVSTLDKLLNALNEAPLASWKDKIEVIDARARRARETAARHLEPSAVRVSLESATLKNEAEVTQYLAGLRDQIMNEINKDNTVIIS